MASVGVIDKIGKKIETLKLNDKLFDGKVNKPLLQQVVTMYLANQRKAHAKIKTRGEVRGGGKKPWRQKGTGRARAGSIRSPLWRGGGVVFGPQPKDWHYQLPKKIKTLALLASLNAKVNEKKLVVIDELKLESHKTKDLIKILERLKLNKGNLVLVLQNPDENIKRAARNIRGVCLLRAQDANAYQILVNDAMLIEKQALESIEKKLTRHCERTK